MREAEKNRLITFVPLREKIGTSLSEKRYFYRVTTYFSRTARDAENRLVTS